jgi:hypothetical protein
METHGFTEVQAFRFWWTDGHTYGPPDGLKPTDIGDYGN